MLTVQQTQFLSKLSHNFQDKGYVIQEWNDIFDLLGDEKPDNTTCKEMWEQIKINNCIIIKFKDEEQVCFCMTDKAKLLCQEFDLMQQQAQEKSAVISQDSLERTVMVLPDSSQIEKIIDTKATKPKFRYKVGAFFAGLLGGVLGGFLSGGAVFYLLQSLIG